MSLYIQPGLRDRDPANPDDDPIGDEMREVGLTRDEVSEKAFLAARQMLLEGNLLGAALPGDLCGDVTALLLQSGDSLDAQLALRPQPARRHASSVKETGARAGAILEGAYPANAGLRLRVHRAQPTGRRGRVEGSLTLIAAGDGPYAPFLRKFVGDDFHNAADLLDEVGTNSDAAKVRHILNANLLRVAENQGAEIQRG